MTDNPLVESLIRYAETTAAAARQLADDLRATLTEPTPDPQPQQHGPRWIQLMLAGTGTTQMAVLQAMLRDGIDAPTGGSPTWRTPRELAQMLNRPDEPNIRSALDGLRTRGLVAEVQQPHKLYAPSVPLWAWLRRFDRSQRELVVQRLPNLADPGCGVLLRGVLALPEQHVDMAELTAAYAAAYADMTEQQRAAFADDAPA